MKQAVHSLISIARPSHKCHRKHTDWLRSHRNRRASRSDSRRVRMSPSRTGPCTAYTAQWGTSGAMRQVQPLVLRYHGAYTQCTHIQDNKHTTSISVASSYLDIADDAPVGIVKELDAYLWTHSGESVHCPCTLYSRLVTCTSLPSHGHTKKSNIKSWTCEERGVEGGGLTWMQPPCEPVRPSTFVTLASLIPVSMLTRLYQKAMH